MNEKLFHSPNIDVPSTQKELAESYGITQQTMNNYMRMANMIPELEDLVDTGIVTNPFAHKYSSKGYGIGNPIKLGRCIKELERIYGIREGRPEKLPKVSEVNQSDIADMIGISVDTLNNYKKLTNMITELQDLVDTRIPQPLHTNEKNEDAETSPLLNCYLKNSSR